MTDYLDTDQRIDRAVSYAISQVGKPYKATPRPPKNWSAGKLMSKSWESGGVSLSSNVRSQFRSMSRIKDVTAGNNGSLQQGDLLFFFSGGSETVSMYVGSNSVVEVSTSGVQQTTLWNTWNLSHFTYAARPKRIGTYGGDASQAGPDSSRTGENNNNFQPVIVSTKEIGKNAIAVSDIFGTPRTARFAVMNLTNETIYLKQTDSTINLNSDSWIKSKPVILGNEREYIINIADASNSSNVDIKSNWIQSESQAMAVGALLANSLNTQFKMIVVDIFGNPLVQLGDIVRFNFATGDFQSGPEDLYIVSAINISYSNGLSTSIELRPLIETISTV